ncbi:MAG: hypothetical protein OER95_15170, partial [Acidimicrobiia bacterium]|nr:hypothetical protein [Acidimicrobiia bacterium]
TTVAATIVNQLMRPANLGLANPGHANNPWDGLMGRIEGFQRTWLSPGQMPRDLLILMIAVLIIVFGWLIRDRSQATMITVVLGVTLALALVRALAPEPVLIFGLLMACPLLILGFVKALPLMNDNSEMMLCGVTFGAFAVAVAATQYRFGGVAEWGGRYFAAGLPFATAAAVPGLGRIQGVFPPVQKRRIITLALATALTVNLAGLRSLADSRDRTRAMVDEIAEAMADVRVRDLAGPGSTSLAFSSEDEPKPIVVTTITAVGRLSWDIVDDGAWLLVDEGQLDRMARTLRQLGVYRFTLVSINPEDDLTGIGRYYETESWVVTDDVPADVIIVTAIDRP